ncbi:MAG: DUF4097 family beta strand repeat protein [Phycisphaerae bacterium]|jgi:hypothetical protein
MHHWLSVTLLLLAGFAATGCQGAFRAARDVSLDVAWADYDSIIVRTANGRVDLAVGPPGLARITGSRTATGATPADAESALDDFEVVAEPASGAPRTLVVELRPPTLPARSIGASLAIRVPRACAAEVHATNGSIRIDGMCGPLEARSSNGSIELRNCAGDARLYTSNGRVDAGAVAGRLEAVTSNGNCIARDIGGDARIETSNGNVELTAARGGVQIETSNGSVTLDAVPPAAGRVVVRTSNGSIDACLPASLDADLLLHAGNGRLDTQFGDVPMKLRRIERSHLEAVMNAGGGHVEARTSNGDIRLRCRG